MFTIGSKYSFKTQEDGYPFIIDVVAECVPDTYAEMNGRIRTLSTNSDYLLCENGCRNIGTQKECDCEFYEDDETFTFKVGPNLIFIKLEGSSYGGYGKIKIIELPTQNIDHISKEFCKKSGRHWFDDQMYFSYHSEDRSFEEINVKESNEECRFNVKSGFLY